MDGYIGSMRSWVAGRRCGRGGEGVDGEVGGRWAAGADGQVEPDTDAAYLGEAGRLLRGEVHLRPHDAVPLPGAASLGTFTVTVTVCFAPGFQGHLPGVAPRSRPTVR